LTYSTGHAGAFFSLFFRLERFSMSEKILCIAEKLSLAEAAGNVLASLRGVAPELSWEAKIPPVQRRG